LVSLFCQTSGTHVHYRQSMDRPAYCVFVLQPFLLRLWEYCRVPVTWPLAVSACIPCISIKHSVLTLLVPQAYQIPTYTPQNGILYVRCRFMNSSVCYIVRSYVRTSNSKSGAHPEFFTERGQLTLRIHIINFFIKKLYCKNHTINIPVTTLYAVAIYTQITNYMVQSPWEANSSSANQEIPPTITTAFRLSLFLARLSKDLSKSEGLVNSMRHGMLLGWRVVSTLPNPSAGGPPLSAVCGHLFNKFVAAFHIGRCSSFCNWRTCHYMLTGTHLPWAIIYILNKTTYSMIQFKSQDLIFLILIHLKRLKLFIYFSKLQYTSPQSISVADIGCRIIHMKHLVSCLQNLFFFKFWFGKVELQLGAWLHSVKVKFPLFTPWGRTGEEEL
jgi:hypothetical protein